MSKKIGTIIKYVLFLSLGVGLMFLVFRNMDFDQMFQELSKAKLNWIFLSMLLALLSHISRAVRWNLLLEPLGYNPKVQNSIAAVFIAYFANILLPRFGEVARCTVLNKTDNVPIQTLVGTVIIERTFDFICLLICMVLTIFMNIELFGGFFYDNLVSPINSKVSSFFNNNFIFTVLMIGVLLIVSFFVIKNFKKLIPQKAKDFLKGILDGVKSISKLQKKWTFIFHTIFIWAMYFAMVYVCFFSLEFTSKLGVSDGFFLLIAGGLGMAAPVQGGIGAYHYMVASALVILPNFLSDFNGGVIFATVVHTAQTILMFSVGLLTLGWLFLKGINLKDVRNKE